MRAICLSVAGLVCAAVGQAATPTILSFTELKSLEALWGAHPDDKDLTEKLASNYALDALGVTGFGANGLITGRAKTEPELALQAYAKEALAASRSGMILGVAGSAMWVTSAVTRELSGRDMAQILIDRAIELQPRADRWRDQRIQFTITRERYSFWKPLTAEVAYPMAKADLDAMDAMGRNGSVGSVGMLAFRAGKLEDAEGMANELTALHDQTNWNYGNAVLKGNSLLGLVALKKGVLLTTPRGPL